MDGAAAWFMVRSTAHACVSEGSVWMSSSSDWEMPQAVQPKPENYTYDLEPVSYTHLTLPTILRV